MSRRSRITTSQQIDRDQRRRVRNAHMWSEAPLPSDPAVMRNSGDSGRWDPTWPDPMLSRVVDLWAEVGYEVADPMLSRVVDLWAEVGYEAGVSPGDPLLESRGAQALAEVAHVEAAGQRQSAGLLAEVAVTGVLDPVVRPDGSYAAQAVAEVAFKESPGVRTEAGIIVEVAGT
jgi:hypothetical protein